MMFAASLVGGQFGAENAISWKLAFFFGDFGYARRLRRPRI
jgi:hypothetical protein